MEWVPVLAALSLLLLAHRLVHLPGRALRLVDRALRGAHRMQDDRQVAVGTRGTKDAVSRTRRLGTGGIVLGLMVVAIVITIAAGTPSTLPEIALSSRALFHLERAAALFLPAFLSVVILSRAFAGELPYEVSREGLKYAERLQFRTTRALQAIRHEFAAGDTRLENTVIKQEALVRASATELDGLSARCQDLEAQIAALRKE